MEFYRINAQMLPKVNFVEVGYPDEYYFSKVFKRNVGMPPRTYADSLSKINYKKSLKDKKCYYSPLYWNAISAIKRKK